MRDSFSREIVLHLTPFLSPRSIFLDSMAGDLPLRDTRVGTEPVNARRFGDA
jgi:hypothetical protein